MSSFPSGSNTRWKGYNGRSICLPNGRRRLFPLSAAVGNSFVNQSPVRLGPYQFNRRDRFPGSRRSLNKLSHNYSAPFQETELSTTINMQLPYRNLMT